MSAPLHLFNSYKPIVCGKEGCGVAFALSSSFIRDRKRDHATWYCPNGHPRHWPGESDLERLQREKQELERRLHWANESRDSERSQRKMTENSNRVLRGHLTRHKKRAAAGVCPCCNRTFHNMQRHMKSKHPDYGGRP